MEQKIDKYFRGSDGAFSNTNPHILGEHDLLRLKADLLRNLAKDFISLGLDRSCDRELLNQLANGTVDLDILDTYTRARGIEQIDITLSPEGYMYHTIEPSVLP